jgi:hypothetical protein
MKLFQEFECKELLVDGSNQICQNTTNKHKILTLFSSALIDKLQTCLFTFDQDSTVRKFFVRDLVFDYQFSKKY